MGFVDRGGGREAKGSSLRRSKKNPGAASTRNKSSLKNYTTPATRTTPTPPAALVPILQSMVTRAGRDDDGGEGVKGSTDPHHDATQGLRGLVQEVRQLMRESFPDVPDTAAPTDVVETLDLGVDAAVALLSRKLEGDVDELYRRAVEEGHLSAVLCWSNELERQPLLMETCRNHNKLALPSDPAHARPAAPTTEGRKDRSVRFALDASETAGGAAGRQALVRDLTGGEPGARSHKRHNVALYAVVGVHVNNIDRMSRKVQEQWMDEIEKQARSPEVLGILSGLHLGRESGTHYAQEWTLRECWRLAGELQLPLVLHLHTARASREEMGQTGAHVDPTLASAVDASAGGDGEAEAMADATARTANRAAEILQELLASTSAAPVAVVLHNGLAPLAASPALRELVRTHRPPPDLKHLLGLASTEAGDGGTSRSDVPVYVLVTADGLATEPAGAADVSVTPTLAALLPGSPTAVIDGAQLLVGTGSPWATPQTIPDVYLRGLPNEPANYRYVVEAVHAAMCASAGVGAEVSCTVNDLASLALRNFIAVFFAEAARECARHVGGSDAASDNDGAEERRFVSQSLHASGAGGGAGGGGGGAGRPGVTPTMAFVCVQCRAPLFHLSAVLRHKKGGAGQSSAAMTKTTSTTTTPTPSQGKKSGRLPKKGRGRRVVSSDEDEGGDGRGELADCPCSSAILLQAELDGSVGEDVAAVKHGGGVASLLSSVAGCKGEYAAGVFAVSSSAAVACAACQAKLGDAQWCGTCYDCGALLRGATLRLRPRAVERCPVLPAGAGAGADVDAARGGETPLPEEGERTELDLLLAAAAREREQWEREEREREEAAALADAHGGDGRRQKERKKNVKSNNRSNFTHFRNKDFAPRLAKEKKLSHQRQLEGYTGEDGNEGWRDAQDDSRSSSSSSSRSSSSSGGGGRKERSDAPASHEAKSHRKHTPHVGRELERVQSEGEESAEAGPTMMTAATRRQRKKANKKRQQQQQQQQPNSGSEESSEDN